MNNPTPRAPLSRFEIKQDGVTAFLMYELNSDGSMTLWHTEVPSALQGHGIASKLIGQAFSYAREHSLKAIVKCPFAASYVTKHPEVQDLVSTAPDPPPSPN